MEYRIKLDERASARLNALYAITGNSISEIIAEALDREWQRHQQLAAEAATEPEQPALPVKVECQGKIKTRNTQPCDTDVEYAVTTRGRDGKLVFRPWPTCHGHGALYVRQMRAVGAINPGQVEMLDEATREWNAVGDA